MPGVPGMPWGPGGPETNNSHPADSPLRNEHQAQLISTRVHITCAHAATADTLCQQVCHRVVCITGVRAAAMLLNM